MILALLFCLFLPGPAGAQLRAGGDKDLLPSDGYLGRWNRGARSRVFTSADLYGHIDGGAELFLEFGFEQLTVQNYKEISPATTADSQSGEIQLEIYRMTDSVAATGVYLLKCGRESPDAAFGERHTINDYQLIFKRNRFFVLVNNTEGTAALRGNMLEFARHIASRLAPEEPAAPVGTLPKEGIVPDSIRLARGPYALQAVYTLGEGDVLQLQRSITAAAADYRSVSGRKTLIRVDYPDDAAASAAYRHLQANLDSYLKIVAAGVRGFLFKDFEGEYGKVSVSGPRLTIEVHLADEPSLP